MGSFIGHILPGTFFILFGLHWTYFTIRRYFIFRVKQKLSQNEVFKCTAMYKEAYCAGLPVEALFKIFGALIGIIGEVYTAIEDGKFSHLGNAQHSAMYLAFGFNGVCDLLLYYDIPLPNGSDYVSLATACFIEGLLFCLHLHGRTHLDILVHQLLIVAIAVSLIVCFVELHYNTNPLAAFFRCFMALLQGTWFYQIAFILYNPFTSMSKWHEHDHNELMLVATYFIFHIIGLLTFMLLFGTVYWKFNKDSIYWISTNNNDTAYLLLKQNDEDVINNNEQLIDNVFKKQLNHFNSI